MAFPSDTRLLVLHAMRVKGLAAEEVLAAAAGLDREVVAAELDSLSGAGAVTHRQGRLSGWSLTAEGRAQHAKLVSAELDVAGARDAVNAAYREFLAVNSKLLDVCTRWQLRVAGDGSQELNPHDDPVYDQSVIVDLRRVDDAVQPVCRRLADTLDRYRGYGPRLAAAVTKVEAGETEWFTKPLIDSYHTVWFELHEDLLTTLGIERSKEEP